MQHMSQRPTVQWACQWLLLPFCNVHSTLTFRLHSAGTVGSVVAPPMLEVWYLIFPPPTHCPHLPAYIKDIHIYISGDIIIHPCSTRHTLSAPSHYNSTAAIYSYVYAADSGRSQWKVLRFTAVKPPHAPFHTNRLSSLLVLSCHRCRPMSLLLNNWRNSCERLCTLQQHLFFCQPANWHLNFECLSRHVESGDWLYNWSLNIRWLIHNLNHCEHS